MSNLGMSEKVTINKGVLWILGGISPLMILSFFFYLGSFMKDLEGKTFESPQQKEEVISHVKDDDIHMTYKEKAIEFVPRTEIDYKLNDIKDDLEDIKKALRIKDK